LSMLSLLHSMNFFSHNDAEHLLLLWMHSLCHKNCGLGIVLDHVLNPYVQKFPFCVYCLLIIVIYCLLIIVTRVFGFTRAYFKSVTSDVWMLIKSIKHKLMIKGLFARWIY
jgi:hypothetical protein